MQFIFTEAEVKIQFLIKKKTDAIILLKTNNTNKIHRHIKLCLKENRLNLFFFMKSIITFVAKLKKLIQLLIVKIRIFNWL